MAKEANKETKNEFDKRAFVSVFAGFSFILVVLTGLTLFSAPSCRVARDTGWTVWGHSRDRLAAVHICFTALFAITVIYHIYIHWTAITKYFKAKTSEGVGLRAEWAAALLICLVVYVGAVRSVWPFSSIIEWRESYKYGEDGQTGQGQGWRGGRGQAPIGGATGYSDSEEREFQDRPQIGEDEPALQDQGLQRQGLNATQRGMGRMTLSEFCRAEGIDLSWATARLKDKGFTAQETMTMRQIAANAGIHPREIRQILQTD